jgi:hypothetical protein
MNKVKLLCIVAFFGLFMFAGQTHAADFHAVDSDTPAILSEMAMSDPTVFLSDEEIAYVRGSFFAVMLSKVPWGQILRPRIPWKQILSPPKVSLLQQVGCKKNICI